MKNTKRTFTINRTTWRRGGDRLDHTGPTFMLSLQGHKCCLGHIASQCGFTDKDLLLHKGPMSVVLDAGATPAGFLTYRNPCILEGRPGYVLPTPLTGEAIRINDAPYMSDAEREAQLIALFQRYGYTIKFVGDAYLGGYLD